VGPVLAELIFPHPTRRAVTRAGLMLAAPVVGLLAWTGPWPPLLLLLSLPLAWRRRRRQGGGVGVATGLVLSLILANVAPAAAAQSYSLRVSPFFPAAVGSGEIAGAAVSYADVYGPHGTWRIELDYAWYPLDTAGELGFGGRGGVAVDNGKAIARDEQGGGFIRAGEQTRMLYFPLSIFGRYRAHYVEDQPVVVALSAGVDLWPFLEERETAGEAIQNFTSGWHVAGELELLLDWAEPRSAAFMQENWGIHDTLLYGGYQYSQLDGLGGRRTLDLTHHDWTVGLRFLIR
jgi:hypothetical protein